MARALCDTGGLCIVFWCESAAVLGGLCGRSSNACGWWSLAFALLRRRGRMPKYAYGMLSVFGSRSLGESCAGCGGAVLSAPEGCMLYCGGGGWSLLFRAGCVGVAAFA
eukprot:scaffold549_cov117-Isochrysis_galbana.AAC.14